MPGADVPALVTLAQQWQLLVVQENLEVRFVHPLLASAGSGPVTRIYRKLGIRSRSDLTRPVVDDELSFPAGP
ncbi:MAG TPA: hypothetical protein VJ979_06455 [Actinomycetota bacterium]|nr:hypothetical protein [Actinomycetota bacterium]